MNVRHEWMVVILALAMAACSQGADQGKAQQPAIPVTVTMAGTADVEIVERSIGRILDPAATLIPAELAARVVWLGVDVGDAVKKGQPLVRLDDRDARARVAAATAEVARLNARIPAQERLLARYRKLAADKFVSPTMLDRAEAELAALRRARDAAKAALERARLAFQHTVVKAPMDGVIQKRFVSAGDFARAGGPLLQLVSVGADGDGNLTIAIPFPETRARHIRPGQRVRLHLPSGGPTVSATIDELSPMIGADNGAFEARAHIENPGGWRPGGSVVAEVIVATHRHAVVVPEAAVVLRPAGQVVYRIEGTGETRTAHAVQVKTGEHLDGRIEITHGLRAGVTIAVDGAAFLTDGARVLVTAGSGAGA